MKNIQEEQVKIIQRNHGTIILTFAFRAPWRNKNFFLLFLRSVPIWWNSCKFPNLIGYTRIDKIVRSVRRLFEPKILLSKLKGTLMQI